MPVSKNETNDLKIIRGTTQIAHSATLKPNSLCAVNAAPACYPKRDIPYSSNLLGSHKNPNSKYRLTPNATL